MRLVVPFALTLLCASATAIAQGTAAPTQPDFAAIARRAYEQAQTTYKSEPTNPVVAWKLARACFDLADCASKNSQRAELAQEGIGAAEKAIAQDPKSAPAHYYLGMDFGELAQTKTLGALRLVGKIEREFKSARDLDEHFDYAGPDRNLGMLYRDAPSIGSVGSRTKARQHLQRAVELTPDYPENRLALLEGCVKWSDWSEARKQLKALEELWPAARKAFIGEAWASSLADWEQRMAKCKKTLAEKGK